MTTTPQQSPEEMAEKRYPLEDPRKVMLHDNSGQRTRQQAFIDGYNIASAGCCRWVGEDAYHFALKWYKQGALDVSEPGTLFADGIDADFYDQYGDELKPLEQPPLPEANNVVVNKCLKCGKPVDNELFSVCIGCVE